MPIKDAQCPYLALALWGRASCDIGVAVSCEREHVSSLRTAQIPIMYRVPRTV